MTLRNVTAMSSDFHGDQRVLDGDKTQVHIEKWTFSHASDHKKRKSFKETIHRFYVRIKSDVAQSDVGNGSRDSLLETVSLEVGFNETMRSIIILPELSAPSLVLGTQ